MFENEIAVNAFLIDQFERIARDLTETQAFSHSPGHGHTPIWIVGHLTIVAELGQRTLGGRVSHPKWLRRFGPGSKDDLAGDGEWNFGEMRSNLVEEYRKFRELAAAETDTTRMNSPHGNAIFEGSPIVTVSHVVTHLLTSHFGFHLAQLSSTRRSAGFEPVF